MVNRSNAKTLILEAFMRMMGGIVRLALRNGVNCNELVDICKLLYVKISAEEYGIRGRETNASRIELMTGIDRKEVKVIKAKVKAINQYDGEPDVMGKILSEWHSNPFYSDQDGPLTLEFEGDAPSFCSLVQECSKRIAAVTVLRELKYSKVVIETEEGLLKPIKQVYIPNYYGHGAAQAPTVVNPKAIGLGSSMLTDHINTIFHNLYRHDSDAPEKFDLRATNQAVKLSKVPEFYQMVDRSGMELLVKVDNWLSANQVNSDEPSIRLGIGVYSIEGLDTSIGQQIDNR